MFLEYKLIGFFFLIAVFLSFTLFSVAFFMSFSAVNNKEKLSEYECGFEPFDSATRHPFDVHFYIVGILFLIFDVEIAILFPWVLGFNNMSWGGVNIVLIILFILIVGFIYEWKRGALTWVNA